MSLLLKSGKAPGFLKREEDQGKPVVPAGRQRGHACSSVQPHHCLSSMERKQGQVEKGWLTMNRKQPQHLKLNLVFPRKSMVLFQLSSRHTKMIALTSGSSESICCAMSSSRKSSNGSKFWLFDVFSGVEWDVTAGPATLNNSPCMWP